MAIDSREKRQSAASVGYLPLPTTPTPNASPDAEWRQEVGWGYSGIAADAPSGAGAAESRLMTMGVT